MSGDMSSVPPDARGITTADDFRITSPASHVRVSLMGPDHLLRINDENGDPLVVVGRDGCVDMIAGVSYHEASRRFWEAMADVQMVRDAFARNPPEGWVVQQTIPLSKNPMWGTARLDDFTNTQPLPDGRINDLYSRIGGRVICNACNVQPDWPGEHRCFRDDAGSLLTCECPSMLCRLIREEVTVAELEAEDAAAAGPSVQPRYPYKDGDTLVLGPECFVARDGSVLCWRGENYVPQGEQVVQADHIVRAAAINSRPTIDAQVAETVATGATEHSPVEVRPTARVFTESDVRAILSKYLAYAGATSLYELPYRAIVDEHVGELTEEVIARSAVERVLAVAYSQGVQDGGDGLHRDDARRIEASVRELMVAWIRQATS